MKKKRKKKATLLSFLPQCPSPQYSTVTSKWPPGLSSAPDVPNRYCVKNRTAESLQFARAVLSKDSVWGTGTCQDIQLKSFLRQLTEHVMIRYDSLQLDDQLFVHIPLEPSRDSFIELLDYAEETLKVQQVVACIDKHHPDFQNLVRSFHFMGFEAVSADQLGSYVQPSVVAPSMFHFMGYEI